LKGPTLWGIVPKKPVVEFVKVRTRGAKTKQIPPSFLATTKGGN